MNDSIRIKAAEKFASTNENFTQVMEDLQLLVVRTVISKGVLQNALVYENEQLGYKVNGKIIAKPIKKNNCYRYSYDENNRIILVEEMSEFLGKFHYYTMYFYSEGNIETMRWAGEDLSNVTVYSLCENRHRECFLNGKDGCTYSEYFYNNGKLSYITSQGKCEYYETSTTNNFYYKPDGTLQKIIKEWATGGTQVKYTTEKINYKKLQDRIFNDVEQALLNFVEHNSNEKLVILSFECYTGHGYLSMSADVGNCIYPDSPADWSHTDICSTTLIEAPLDCAETQKILETIAKVADDITKKDFFINMLKASGFYCTMFHHDMEHIEQDNKKLSKILSNNVFFKLAK